MALIDDLIRHEGMKLKPYICPAGKVTIGVGRNIQDNGISEAEARYLLKNDIIRCWAELHKALPWALKLPSEVQDVLCNMTFNMGIGKLLGFKKALAALKAGQWNTAAAEMLDSDWARQVGRRATELAEIVKKQA